jgi:quaternary ammonium compound-resistance protein SugE
MTTAWLYLIGAGLAEVVWATTLKKTEGWTHLGWSSITAAAMGISFWLLAAALREIPMGTAYAIWVGIGAVGVAAVGIILFGESTSPAKLGFLALIVVGIAGLKWIS